MFAIIGMFVSIKASTQLFQVKHVPLGLISEEVCISCGEGVDGFARARVLRECPEIKSVIIQGLS